VVVAEAVAAASVVVIEVEVVAGTVAAADVVGDVHTDARSNVIMRLR